MYGILITTLLCTGLLAGCSLKNEAQIMAQIDIMDNSGMRKAPAKGDRSVPDPKYRTVAMAQRAAPTNQWYSSIMYQQWGEPVYATPLTVKPTEKGLEVAFPHKETLFTHREDVDIYYLHKPELIITPIQYKPTQALLGNYSDWVVDIEMVTTGHQMRATVSHGSPYVYIRSSHGGFTLAHDKTFKAVLSQHSQNALIVSNSTKTFAIFAPSNARWQQQGDSWAVDGGNSPFYLSVAALPDDKRSTFRAFEKSAFAFITGSQVEWSIDREKMIVGTQFRVETEQMDSGAKQKTILGLYPHHYHQNNNLPDSQIGELSSIRGAIKLFQTNQFSTELTHNGFVPYWPGITTEDIVDDLEVQLNRDIAASRRMLLEEGEGPYWQGKGLQRITQLMHVAKAQGDKDGEQELLHKAQRRAEKWMSGRSEKTYFHYDKDTGTVVSYPEEYDAVLDMNDHHFHYGYWIRAAAEIGMNDPQWVLKWGKLIDALVGDIATTERGLKSFPFIRNFDPYEGHSWASGVQRGPDGNNQESSSEAVNAWAALMLWGSVRNQPELVDLGLYLYNTEIESARHYWFDIYDLTLPEEYLNSGVCILFGGKLVHYTWWIDEPRQIHGINLLPLTPSSTYLGIFPDYIRDELVSLDKESLIYEKRLKRAEPEDIWQDLFSKYLALADPEAGYALWDQFGSFELGDTRSHALHWLQTLREVGTANLKITANTPFYAVFEKEGKKTYMVYNYSQQQTTVQFDDGKQMVALPNQLTIERPGEL